MLRHAAYRVLRSGSPTPMREVDRVARDAGLDGRDRGLLRQIVGTEVRRRGTLRALVAHFSRGKPSTELACHLRLGLVQVFFLDSIPDHAAVSESVRACVDTIGLSKGRYVNGLMRNAIRARREGHSGDPRRDLIGRNVHLEEPVFRDPEQHPLLWIEDAYSIPAALAKRWQKRYGDGALRQLAETFLEPPPISVRATADVAALADELRALGLEPEPAAHPRVLRFGLDATEAVVKSAAFQEGRATLQGETAIHAAELVDARADERVLDLCAAPGGKTAVLAGAGARVLACDVEERKLERVREGLARLGLTDRVETRLIPRDEGPEEDGFDAALVDAPCSNTGVLGQRPGARWRFGPAAQASLREQQDALLDRAAARVRPGGRLVYSTCSLEPDENTRRVQAFLERRGGWHLDAEHSALPGPAGAEGERPGPIDGGYAARLVHEPA